MHSQTSTTASIHPMKSLEEKGVFYLCFFLSRREAKYCIGEETKALDSCLSEWQSLYVFVPSCDGNHIQIQCRRCCAFLSPAFHVPRRRDLLKHVLSSDSILRPEVSVCLLSDRQSASDQQPINPQSGSAIIKLRTVLPAHIACSGLRFRVRDQV